METASLHTSTPQQQQENAEVVVEVEAQLANYHDYAQEAAVVEASQRQRPSNSQHFTSHNGQAMLGGDETFPVKLHYMLSDVERDGLSHIISWAPHGRSFALHDRPAFVDGVLKL
jgi:hypothetical protein